MKVITYQCPKCKQKVYARCTNDLHNCFCGSLSCHGNIQDSKVITDYSQVIITEEEIDATPNELSRDFYYNLGKYGTIKVEKGK